MNDRRTTETIIHANLMIIVISRGIDKVLYPEMETLETLFKIAINDLLAPLDQARGDRLYRRAVRDTRAVGDTYVVGDVASPAKLGLVTFHLLRQLVDVGYLVLDDEGPFMVAMEHVLPLLEEHAAEEKLDTSAQKQARHLFAALQRLGYYPGAQWSDA